MATPQTHQKKRSYKVIVIGSSGTGKTCLIQRFCDGTFLPNPLATLGFDYRQKKMKVEQHELNFLIWDTAGQERYRNSLITR